ncbi:hypothetical protein TIFTF001_015014 [Ficus carica]|uniref:Uncharacterized protein n=1 Tax=Ficus carica TaxID=3494 RepID=A0AA88A6F4_FICCA|nr:hypothetical protein TIFTF001_015014 [Ficus carica]
MSFLHAVYTLPNVEIRPPHHFVPLSPSSELQRFSKTMAFFLNRTTIGSHLRSHFQLLAEDPSLKKYKSQKKNVRRLKKVGDVLTIVVVAA